MKHTPGPWVTDNGGDAFYGVFGPNGGALAYLLDCAPGVQWQSAILPMDAGMTMRERFSVHEANATLMAAAPEMRRLLEIAVEDYEAQNGKWKTGDHWTRQVRELLTPFDGGTEHGS